MSLNYLYIFFDSHLLFWFYKYVVKIFHVRVKKCKILVVYTFVNTGVMTVARAATSLRGIQGRAGRSVRQLGGGDLRNVAVPERVPVKLHIDHLGEGPQLNVTKSACAEAPLKGDSADASSLTVSAPSVCSPVYVLSSCGEIMQRSK